MNIKAVVLDMDGVVLDSEPIYKIAWQRAAEELGYQLDDAVYMALVGRPVDECESELLVKFGNHFPMSVFRSRWAELWKGHVERRGIEIKPGLAEFLNFLKDAHLLVAIATSSDRSYTELSLRCAGVDNRFDIIVTGDQVASGKPAPDIYLEAARRLGCGSSACVAIEDSDAGTMAASSAGMVVVIIPDLKPPSTQAKAAAHRVLHSLHEAPDVIRRLKSKDTKRVD
jgi:HAD superfamily hydrolase (TIGR01509 family)